MAAQPYDEDDLIDVDILIRRVNPKQHVVFDENTGKKRTSSKLFSPSSGPNDGMSVDIQKLIENDGVNVQDFVSTPTFTGSVFFDVNSARNAGLMVGYDPIVGNPYHGEVWGSSKPNRFTKSQKRALINSSAWLVEIPGVDIGG